MSVSDGTCYTFKRDEDFFSKWKNKLGYVPIYHKKKIYLFKVKITEAKNSYNCYNSNPAPHLHISFSVISEEKEPYYIYEDDVLTFSIFNKTIFKKSIKRKINKYKIIDKEYPVENYYYTPGLYSFFMPSGFLPKELLFETKEEALTSFKENFEDLKSYFINDELLKYLDFSIYSESF